MLVVWGERANQIFIKIGRSWNRFGTRPLKKKGINLRVKAWRWFNSWFDWTAHTINIEQGVGETQFPIKKLIWTNYHMNYHRSPNFDMIRCYLYFHPFKTSVERIWQAVCYRLPLSKLPKTRGNIDSLVMVSLHGVKWVKLIQLNFSCRYINFFWPELRN